MSVDVRATPSSSTPLADTVMSAELVRNLREHIVASGSTDVTVGTAPFDGSPLPAAPASSEHDVEAAFRAARRHQPAWAATSIDSRADILLRFHDLVYADRAKGLDIVQLETGKARGSAVEELADVLITARYYARSSAATLSIERRPGALPLLTQTRVYHVPIGVVGIISPWNYPLTLAISDALPALMAGNSVVLKPDAQTIYTALWVVDKLLQAGLPEGVLQVVNGEGPVVGPMVTNRADFVMFTGSTAVGRQVAARCGERLVGCSMELGGKNAMIVTPDIGPQRAARIAAAASYSNSGQLCISMERMYILDEGYDAFMDAFVSHTRSLTLKAGIGWGADVGSLISAKQLQRVTEHVADAVAQGATVLAGGRPRPDIGPYFYEPTILDGVTDAMACARDETFGPVVSVYRVADIAEALHRANDTHYGLNAAVLTGSIKQGRAIAAKLNAGTVNINEGYGAAWASIHAPMGGFGASGIGRRHGPEGLLKYTEAKNVAAQRLQGFTRPSKLSDQTWGDGLIRAVALMKRLGMK
jgi:succinate-semialdehyde dehydrogenase / glutarate-semialdehyde dehydrogenase